MSALWRCSPAGMRCLSEISVKSPLRETYRRDLSETSQERCLFCQVFKTFQIHLKKDAFFVTSLRRLKNISKKMSFVWRLEDVSGISQKRCLFLDASETPQKHLSQVFLVFQKHVTKTRHKNTSQKWFRVISVGLLKYLIK